MLASSVDVEHHDCAQLNSKISTFDRVVALFEIHCSRWSSPTFIGFFDRLDTVLTIAEAVDILLLSLDHLYLFRFNSEVMFILHRFDVFLIEVTDC
jgi:hypothetical protein